MKLNLYLKRANRVTGPLAKHTSHSGMCNNLTLLCGEELFTGQEVFLHFGNHLHNRFAGQEATIPASFTPSDTVKAVRMLEKLNTHPVVKRLTDGAIREQKKFGTLNTVSITFILDVEQQHTATGTDLKTTTCKTLEDFVESCRKYRYFNQARIYMVAAKLKKFYFVAINKEAPYSIFVVDVTEYAEDMAYADQEVLFNLYFYKHYGKAIAGKVATAETKGAGTIGASRSAAGIPTELPIAAVAPAKRTSKVSKVPPKRVRRRSA